MKLNFDAKNDTISRVLINAFFWIGTSFVVSSFLCVLSCISHQISVIVVGSLSEDRYYKQISFKFKCFCDEFMINRRVIH